MAALTTRLVLVADGPTDGWRHRAIWSVFGIGTQGIARLAYGILVARWFGLTALVSYSLALATALLSVSLWAGSTSAAATRFLAHGRGAGSSAIKPLSTQLATLCLIVHVPLSVVGGVYIYTVTDEVAIAFSGCFLSLLLGGQALFRGFHSGMDRTSRMTVLDAISAGISVLGLLLLYVSETSKQFATSVVLVPMIVGLLVTCILAWPVGLPVSLHTGKWKEVGTFVLLAAVGSLASAGTYQGTLMATKSVGTAEEVAVFAAAQQLATPLFAASSITAMVLYPGLSRLHGVGITAYALRQLSTAADALTWGVIAGGLALIAFRSHLVRAAWGEALLGASDTFAILIGAVGIMIVFSPAVQFLSSAGSGGVARTTVSAYIGLSIGTLIFFLTPDISAAHRVAYAYFGAVSVQGFIICIVASRLGFNRIYSLILGTGIFGAAFLALASLTGYWASVAGLIGFIIATFMLRPWRAVGALVVPLTNSK